MVALRVLGASLLLLAGACSGEEPSEGARDPARDLLGGDTTVFDDSPGAFGYPARNASPEHRDRFVVGNSFFRNNWVTAPASTEARDGLGPLFNARSCSGCHTEDGRGAPPDPGGDFVSLLVRLGGDGSDDARYGGQLQTFAIEGVPAEGSPDLSYAVVAGAFADGAPYELTSPSYGFTRLAYGPLAPGTSFSPRVAPAMVGLGLLEAVPDATLLALADPDDADGDGISGRVNHTVSVTAGELRIGRFGWKAGQPLLADQVSGAFAGDMGIASSVRPAPECTSTETECAAAPNGGDPEIADGTLSDVVLYSSLLAVPARRDSAAARRGEELFTSFGCASCHVPSLRTAPDAALEEVADQLIRPFTDLLLHDLGPDLADQRAEGEATGTEWRTPPLWGLGLLRTVSHHTRLLHDGRARDASEAILWHGGEAEAAREAYRGAGAAERDDLLRFLDSL